MKKEKKIKITKILCDIFSECAACIVLFRCWTFRSFLFEENEI